MSLNFHFLFIVKKVLQCIPIYWFTANYRFNYYLMLDTSSEIFQNISILLLFNNLRYADNTTLMAESEEELKSLLMKVKEVHGVTQAPIPLQHVLHHPLGQCCKLHS